MRKVSDDMADLVDNAIRVCGDQWKDVAVETFRGFIQNIISNGNFTNGKQVVEEILNSLTRPLEEDKESGAETGEGEGEGDGNGKESMNLEEFKKWITGIRYACYFLHEDVKKVVINNIRGDNDVALRAASHLGNIEAVRFLVEQGADVNASDHRSSALDWAAYHGYLEIVKFLVEHGANVNINGDLPIRWAAEHGHQEVVSFLLEYGMNNNIVYSFFHDETTTTSSRASGGDDDEDDGDDDGDDDFDDDPEGWLSGKWPDMENGQIVSFNKGRYDLPPGVTGCIEEHDEGADRGGYVPTLYQYGSRLCYYDSEDGWV